MQRAMTSNWHLINLSLSLLVLGLLLWFTFVFFIRVPYAGFYFNPTNGEVVDVYVETDITGFLRDGDIIRRVGDISWERYRGDATQSFFDGIQKGQFVNISIIRNEQALDILWPYPGFTVAEFKARLFNIWLLGYIFWFFGFLTQLLIRPRNARRRLLIAANYLTGLWLVCGTLSGSHVGQSALVLRAVTWLMLPVYLNLHWEFPKPLFRVPKAIWISLYVIAFALAGMEFLQLLPRSLYSLGFVLALSGSLILLFAHFGLQPTRRRDVGLLLIAILIAVIPSMVLGFLYTLGTVPETGAMSLLILPIMPATYFFVIYRRKLGGLELRANRIISLYSFLILLGTVLLLLTLPVSSLSASPQTLILLMVIVALVAAFISILVFPRYQSLVEQRLLGIQLPYQRLPETYSDRITTSTTVTSLAKLLDNEVFPSLFVRQFAFFQVSKESLRVLLTKGLTEEHLPKNDDLPYLVAQAGKYLPESSHDELPWIRLILPLRIDGDLIGLWLFGNRDPDDVYAQSEIPILQALANQTAIALSNIHQTEQLRILYKENINRHEQERMRLALELHDGVLNRMAELSLNLDPTTVSPRFREAYDELTRQLREIVSSLRPPMLQYGLKPACEDLSYNLIERSNGRVKIVADIQAGEDRYPEDIELHIYRILQEASENALQHAHAASIKIDVRLEPNMIAVAIEDNGVGFEMGDHLDLEELLARKHFGLAGIVERCELIGAEMRILSSPQNGVHLHITWTQDMIS
jgi:signal transduction histidine kinase